MRDLLKFDASHTSATGLRSFPRYARERWADPTRPTVERSLADLIMIRR